MPVKAPYRVRQQSQSVGTGAYTFIAPLGSANPFSAFYSNGAVVGYVAFDQANNYEIGYGTFSSSGYGSLTRTTIILSSNANSAVDWPTGTRDVIVFWPAGMPTVDVMGTTTVGLADWGNVFVGSGSGAVVNLPEIDTVPAGFSVEFRNTGSGNFTFTPYATDGDLIEGLTSLACPPGSWSTIYLDAGQWRVLSAPLAVLGSMISPSLSGILNLGVKSASAYDMVIANSETLTAQRVLTLTLGDANRSLTLGGNFTTTGGNVTLTGQGGGSSVTLPASGTLLANALPSGDLFVGNGGGVATGVALSGDATLANTGALTIAAGVVTLAKMANLAASSLIGNATSGSATPTAITIGATLAFSGTALQTAAITGDVTASANSFATTVAKVNGVAYPSGPSTNTVPVVTGSNTVTYEAVPNAALANSSMTIAGHVIALGGTQAIAAGDLSNGTTGSGTVVLATSANLVTPALGVATATSLALGGATIGGNALAVTGTILFNTALSIGSGGTGATTLAANGILYGAGTSAISALAVNSSATVKYLQQVSSGAPSWQQIAASDLSNGTSGSGAIVLVTGATMITPTLGAASATSINKVAFTAPASGSTLTIADGKTLTASNSITVAGTDGKTVTISNSLTFAGSDGTTITFQGTDTYVGRTTTDTLTNKTLNLSNNTVSNFTLAMGATNVFDTDATLAANSDTRVSTQKAIKAYVDNAVTGLYWKAAVIVGTTANISLAGEQTIDGVLTSASRVLVMAQTDQTQNGIYVSAAGAWARSSDANTGPELVSATMFVSQGTTWHDTQWTCTNDSITIGVTNIAFAQVSGAGTYSAGQGLTLSGNQFSVTNNGITYAMIQTVAAVSLIGNPTGGSATPEGITLGGTLAFSGTALQTAAMTGDVTSSANSFATTVAKIQSTVVSGTTGSGNVVFSTSPTLVTPALGTPASGVLTNCTGLPVGSITGLGTGVATWLATPSSANLAAAMTDETGSGALVFGTSPTIATPTITGHFVMEGVTTTGATGTGNIVFSASPTVTGTLTAATISMSGHLTVEGVTSAGATGTGNLVFSIGPTFTSHITVEGVTATGATGTGKFVFDGSPTLVTPVLGVATATSLNKLTLTAPATSATLTLADGKTLTVSNTLTFTGTDSSSVAFGVGGTVLYSGAAAALGAVTITSSSANALAVGQNGTTNPGLKIDLSTATSVTGLLVKPNIGGSGVALSVITSGTNEPLTIDAAGSGPITLGGTSTGAITLTRATTLSAALTYGGVTLSNAVTGTGNMMLSASPTTTGTLTAAAANFSGDVTATDVYAASTGFFGFGGATTNGMTANTGTGVVGFRAGTSFTFNNPVTLTAALTYGGVTLSNSVTGTGSMVLSANAILTGNPSIGGSGATAAALMISTDASNGHGGYVQISRGGSAIAFIGAYDGVLGGSSATGDATFYNNANLRIAYPNGFTAFYGTGLTQHVVFSNVGAVRFNTYGSGAATFDASGNITSVSDPKQKIITGAYVDGLSSVRAAANDDFMGWHKWRPGSGMETEGTYASFFARDNFPISGAVSKNANGINSFSDRPVLMATVRAIDELAAITETHEQKIARLEAEVAELKKAA